MHPIPIRVEPRDGYRIWLEYSDGVSGEVDLSDIAAGHKAWRNREFFERVRIRHALTIEWDAGISIRADQLYADLNGVNLDEQDAIWEAEQAKLPREPRMIKVEPREGYRIWLEYDDGVSGEIDLSDLVGLGVFKAWEDRRFFEQVRLDDFPTAAWPGEIDLCPDSLYAELHGLTLAELLAGVPPKRVHV